MIKVFREAFPVVSNDQHETPFFIFTNINIDQAVLPVVECVLDRIRHQFVDYQSAGDSIVDI